MREPPAGLGAEAEENAVGRALRGDRAHPDGIDLALGHHRQGFQRRRRVGTVVWPGDDDLGQFVDEDPPPAREPGGRHQAEVARAERRVGGDGHGQADEVGATWALFHGSVGIGVSPYPRRSQRTTW